MISLIEEKQSDTEHKSLELGKRAYNLGCKVLGETHSSTLASLSNLIYYYNSAGEYGIALSLAEKLYEQQVLVAGKDSSKAQSAL